jgi:phosphoenolpyruvate-protein kinase (PTS system EI component)
LGLGLDEFSMTASSIPLVKRIIRGVAFSECKNLAKQALDCTGYPAVRSLAEAWMAEVFPNDG